MDSKKKVINVKLVKGKRRARGTAKPKSKTKQKQKQRQTVNVQVSSGGSGGGGTSFIPMPQAPAFDYSLLANLIRPANTVDMPMREAVSVPNPVATREASSQTLAESRGGFQVPTMIPRSRPVRLPVESETEGFISSDAETGKSRADKGKPRGSYKEKQVNVGRNVQNEFVMGSTSGFASGPEEQSRFQAMTGGGGRFGEK